VWEEGDCAVRSVAVAADVCYIFFSRGKNDAVDRAINTLSANILLG